MKGKTMKLRYIFYGLTSGLLFGLSSCSLNYDPIDTYSDVTEGVTDTGTKVVFKDKAAVESHLTTIYNQMRDRQEHWYVDLLLISDSHADNAYAGTTGAEVLPFENNSIEGSNSVLERDWNRYLEDVARANKLICNIDLVTDNSLTTAERAQYKAEAMIFRAMVMFDMVRLWGDFPVITTVADDITSENIEDVYEQYFPAQNTELEAYQQIEKDLLAAIQHAPDNTAGNKTLFTKSVARTLLAKIYAEKPLRDYSKVIRYCDEVKADGFELVKDFSDLFGMNAAGTDAKVRNTKESILEAQFTPGSGNWCTWMFGRDLVNWNNNFTWAKWVTPSRDLINAFKKEGDQIRFQESVVYYDCNWSNYYPSDNYPFMYKCRSANSSIIKYRYADVLLLKGQDGKLLATEKVNSNIEPLDAYKYTFNARVNCSEPGTHHVVVKNVTPNSDMIAADTIAVDVMAGDGKNYPASGSTDGYFYIQRVQIGDIDNESGESSLGFIFGGIML